MKIKNEEYIPLAKDLLVSFTRDFADFTAEDHNYTQAYLDAFQAKIQQVEQHEASNALLVQQKQITKELYLLGENLITPLKSLTIKIKRAQIPTNLTAQIQKDIKRRNFEGVADKLNALIQVLNTHTTALQDKGMKATVPTQMQTAQAAIASKADQQTQFMKQVSINTIDTKNLYKQLYAYITHICEDGKILYIKQQKAQEYTMTKMLQKLHHNLNNSNNNNTES